MEGTLVSGRGAGATFVAATADVLADAVGFRPYHGTVNLQGVDGVDELPLRRLEEDLGDPRCEGVHLRPCVVGGVRGAVIRPLVPDYPEDQVELLAPVGLRALFGLEDGAPVPLAGPEDQRRRSRPTAAYRDLDAFEAVVFDLDNTLVELAVDWAAVHEEIQARFGASLDKPVTEHGQDELFAVAADRGFGDGLSALLERYERTGAEAARPLVGVECLPDLGCPVGVCTANAASAAETALARAGVREAVDAVVARETVARGKPHPEPLLACLEALDVAPAHALFVGDHGDDAGAAAAAGTSFLHVDQLVAGDGDGGP